MTTQTLQPTRQKGGSVKSIDIAGVRFVKDLYPRLKPSDEVIDRYIDALDNLPPIVIARGGILVDGFHRWQAHVRTNCTSINAEDLGDLSDGEIMREAYRRNATHGHQLNAADKKNAADHLYRSLSHLDADARYAEIAEVLGINVATAKKYAADARRDEKEQQQAKAWDMWLDCHTQVDIAEVIGVPRPTVIGWLSEMERRSEFDTPPASQQHFDIWQFQSDADSDTTYFGRMPEQVVENLLWFYTEPGQVVVDLFAGSGTTIEVAKRMGRRYPAEASTSLTLCACRYLFAATAPHHTSAEPSPVIRLTPSASATANTPAACPITSLDRSPCR